MDRARARELLRYLASGLGDQVLLWRGDGLEGSDVDLLALAGAQPALDRELRNAGLSPEPDGSRRTLWHAETGELVVDVMPASEWPAMYPPLDRVLARAARSEAAPPAASDADRLLILAAEAVAGFPVDKIVRKARPLLARQDVAQGLASAAREDGAQALAVLICDLALLERRSRRGRLPYLDAARVARGSRLARAALVARGRGAVAARARAMLPRRPGLLITFSGMDGSGKSRAAERACARLEGQGLPTRLVWGRLAHERELKVIATPFKLLLRRREQRVADRVAAAPPGSHEPAREAAPSAPGRGVVAWAWTLVVALVGVRSHRRGVRARRGGTTVVCDRWMLDAVVDLELRYGPHPLARRLLERGLPCPDLAIWLEVDADTAAARKPGDQDLGVLRRMETLYASGAQRHGAVRVAAQGAPEEVDTQVDELIAALLGPLEQRGDRHQQDLEVE